MANMSYCAFQNTSSDLLDCEGRLEEIVNSFKSLAEANNAGDLSDYEMHAARRLIRTSMRIANEYAHLLAD